jgi:mono/diheme cytochrome c family protein
MRKLAPIAVIVTVAEVACLLIAFSSRSMSASTSAAPAPHVYSAVANGGAIFQTGRDFDGIQIRAQSPQPFNSCEACHRADGSGGKRFADGAVSADLRHRALVIDQKHPYDVALLERAISKGIDNEGQPLDRVMPHWRLSPRDLHDVAEYVLLKLK